MQTVTRPNPISGTVVQIGGFGTIFKVPGSSVNGAYSIVEHTLEPGILASPLHRHSREDELSYVIEGEVTALLGDQLVTAARGSYVVKPRNQFHAFWNSGASTLRILEIVSPAGFETYFEELGAILKPNVPPDIGAVIALAARYGIEMDMGSVPMLMQQYGVRLG